MKNLTVVGVICGLLALSSISFAEEIKGSVTSIDAASSKIVVQDSVSGESKTVMVHPNVLSNLSVGSVVSASINDSGKADTIEVEVV